MEREEKLMKKMAKSFYDKWGVRKSRGKDLLLTPDSILRYDITRRNDGGSFLFVKFKRFNISDWKVVDFNGFLKDNKTFFEEFIAYQDGRQVFMDKYNVKIVPNGVKSIAKLADDNGFSGFLVEYGFKLKKK